MKLGVGLVYKQKKSFKQAMGLLTIVHHHLYEGVLRIRTVLFIFPD
jgi:hypothetical protein